jgi:hypothetical protein
MEPTLLLDQHLSPILAELKTLEPLVYAADIGKKRAYFEQLLAPEFWEIGASGNQYSREFVLAELEKRQQNPREEVWHTSGHHLQQLSDSDFLMTYTLHQPTRLSRRASIWRKYATRWMLVYHQGTVVQGVTPQTLAQRPT